MSYKFTWFAKLILVWAFLFLISGCGANFFAAQTTATYQVSPDGTKLISYTSNKEQQGLDMDLQEKDGKPVSVKIHVDKASTSEQVIAAALAAQIQMGEILKTLLPILEKAAMTGGS